MDTVTRRKFLAASGVVGAGALLAGATQVDWAGLLKAADANPGRPGQGVLVLVTLYGGNDGLSTLVPYADPAYARARPHLAYTHDEVLDVGQGLGLNPSLKGLRQVWQRGELALVRGVGYPNPDRSHFRSMDIWQSASPAVPLPTGWLGRWLDTHGASPVDGVSVGATLPPLMAGATTAGAALPLAGLHLPTGALGSAFSDLAHPQSGEPELQAATAQCTLALHEADRVLGPAVDKAGPASGGRGAAGALSAQLAVVGRCIAAGVPTRAYAASLGGFDTHADEKATQTRLLAEVDSAVSTFLDGVRATPRSRDVVVAVYTEFGRRVMANASDGTDHGTANVMMIAGAGVKGGFYGSQPSLTDLDAGDLVANVDFRSVYAGLLDGVLGADPEPLLGGWNQRLSVLA